MGLYAQRDIASEGRSSMRVLICGDRNWDSPDIIWTILDGLSLQDEEMVLVEGGAKGADFHALGWALDCGIKVDEFQADWNQHGRAAGPKRNQQMIETNPDIVIGFHDDILNSKGTQDMLKRAEKAGVPTYVFSRWGNEI